jgi:hypothetical protein
MKRNFSFMMDAGVLRSGFLALLLVLINFNSYSQSCDSLQCNCEKGDMNPSGIMIGHSHPKGTWMFSYRYMNMQMRDNLSGMNKVSDDIIYRNYIMSPGRMSMDMHMIMAMYGITSRLSVMAMLNYNVLSMNMNMQPGTMQMQMNGMMMSNMDATSMTTKTSGLSDTKLYAMYSLLNGATHQLMLSAGVNLPTGSVRLKGDGMSMLPGQRLPYMMQLGSGTYDILPGITYLLNKGNVTWGTQVTGTIRTGYNSLGYAYGNELTVSTWGAYRFLPWLSASLRAEAYAANAIAGKDPALFEIMEPDAKASNYGGQRASAYAGFNIYLKKLANSRI